MWLAYTTREYAFDCRVLKSTRGFALKLQDKTDFCRLILKSLSSLIATKLF